MGVQGLQTFVRENRQSLCRSLILPERDPHGTQKGTIPIVVDAWGVAFKLYIDSLPWASGGEYLRFYQIVKRLVSSWRKVGLEPIFVFDGASPVEKHETNLKRMSERLSIPRLFYATSVPSRSEPSFGRGDSSGFVLPIFSSHSLTFALHRLGVATHHCAMGEADAVCVSMAEKVGGFVLGQDSDFFILVSKCERGGGYAPLDMMMWIEGEVPSEQEEEDSGLSDMETFQPASNGRKKKAYTARQSPLLPPPTFRHPVLVLTVIPPISLRQRLRLPANYMALFASLAGNDYTSKETIDRFYIPGTHSQKRIEKAARVLREQLYSPTANKSNDVNPGDYVVELVRRVIKKMCIRDYDTEPDLMRAVNEIIEAALQYSPPHGGDCCPIYPFCGELDSFGCQSSSLSRPDSPVTDDDGVEGGPKNDQKSALEAYAATQKKGILSITHGWLYPNRTYLRGAMEDPSLASHRTTRGSMELRRRAYTILDEGIGGMRFTDDPLPSGDDGVKAISEGKSEEKELKVLLGLERGESKSEISVQDSESTQANEPTEPRSPPRVVIEYSRIGSSGRIGTHSLKLPPKRDWKGITPTCLLPLPDRLEIYLGALNSNKPSVRALPSSLQPLVACLRFCICEMAELATQSKKRAINPLWRKNEALAVLKAGVGTFAQWARELEREEMGPRKKKKTPSVSPEETAKEWPNLETRNCQLIAQFTNAILDSKYLAQALLLLSTQMPYFTPLQMDLLPEPLTGDTVNDFGPTHLTPFVFLSGVNLHTLLIGQEPPSHLKWRWTSKEEEVLEKCWAALIEDLEEGTVLGLEPLEQDEEEALGASVSTKRCRKRCKEKTNAKGKVDRGKTAAGMFDLLADMTI